MFNSSTGPEASYLPVGFHHTPSAQLPDLPDGIEQSELHHQNSEFFII